MASDENDPGAPGETTGEAAGEAAGETTAQMRPATPILPELVAELWNQFRSGGRVSCPRDAGPMAASVDGASAAYRLVCVHCGHATPWFEAKLGIVTHVRGTSTRPPPA